MKRLLFGFVVGVVTGAGGYWYWQEGPGQAHLGQAADSVAAGAGKARDSLRETFSDLSVSNITEELSRTSMVVREKARSAGHSIADATANARVTAAVKGRLVAEPGLSAFSINVDTTDGLVTLSGKVSSHEQVGRAVKLALDTEGVRKVISTLQVSAVK